MTTGELGNGYEQNEFNINTFTYDISIPACQAIQMCANDVAGDGGLVFKLYQDEQEDGEEWVCEAGKYPFTQAEEDNSAYGFIGLQYVYST